MAAVSSEKEVFEDTGEGEEEIAREDEDNLSTGKRAKHSKKHKHKHSKKHKHKHKKRKHKKRSHSRSRSKSSSRSRSKSPESEDLPFYTKSDFENLSESGKNYTSEQDFEDKPKILSEESQDSILEDIVLANCEDSFSFKLTKSPSRSGSPLSVPANQLNTKEPEVEKPTSKSPESLCIENKVNLGFPLKIGIIPKSKSKSPDILEKKMNKRSRSRTPISDSEINKRSRSGSKSRSKSPDVSDPKINKKSGSRLPDPKIKKRSRSRSRSRTQVKSKNSGSKSPRKSDSKKKSRSSLSSKSSSSSKSRSRSHSKYRSISKSKSRSRSPRRKKRKGKSRSRSSSYSRRESRRKGRSRSRSVESRSPRKRRRTSYSNRTKGRSRSRSSTYRDRRSGYDVSLRRSYRDNSTDRRRHYDSRSRRTRSRSPKRRYSRRSRSVSPVRSHRHKSRSRSPRRGRSKSPRGGRYRRRSRSRSVRSRRRSRSRSYSSRRRRSRSRSRSKSRDRHQKRSRSKSTDKSTDGGKGVAMAVIPTTNADKPTAQDLVGKAPTVSDPSNKRSLEQLTEFCKKLAEARGIEGEEKTAESKEEEGEEEDASVEISHPFLVAPKRDITIPQVIFPVKPLPPIISSDKPLTEQFPVSCGTKHHEKEQENTVNETVPDVDGSASQVQQVFQQPQSQQKLDISSLVVKRMDAQRRLQADPNDVDAMLSLQEVEMKLNNWCQSNVKPGQFTGQLAKSMMPKEKFNSGYQAWARKDMFHNLNPVSGGVGMKLLQKMGWEPGQVLGKRGEGMVEPIALTVKVDRRGLSSNTEKSVGKKGGSKPAVDLQGKHPISSLQEYCARRKWQVPDFTLIFDEGPPHSKQFLFKVVVNGYEYQHPVVSSNKKHAKAQAAVAALKGLGLVPEDAEY